MSHLLPPFNENSASYLNNRAVAAARAVADTLAEMTSSGLQREIDTGALITNPALGRGSSRKLGAFYAPFDWINSAADIVIIGVTPGKQQASTALQALHRKLQTLNHDNHALAIALREAKQMASFDGQMRTIAAQLMDHFHMHKLFGLATTAELFGKAADRAHYTSVYRYPVLQEKNDLWGNYSGGEDGKSRANPLLIRFVEEFLVPELQCFPAAWLVPFGPTPAAVLQDLSQRGIVDGTRILSGLNHPSGTQWNRHRCQLDQVEHTACAANVGCSKIQERSRALHDQVAPMLA